MGILDKANESLESLDMSENRWIQIEAYTLISMKYLDNMYSNLTSLRLEGNFIGDESAMIIISKLLYKTPLWILDLSKNNLSNTFAELMGEVLT